MSNDSSGRGDYVGPVLFLVSWAILAFWLSDPGLFSASVACVAGCLFFLVSLRKNTRYAIWVGTLVAFSGITAIWTSLKVRTVEFHWEEARETLILVASGELDVQLDEAIMVAENLALEAAARNSPDRKDTFEALGDLVDATMYESGVVVYGPDGSPRAWSGRFRRMPSPRIGIVASISHSFAVLEVTRDTNSTIATATVVLWADSSLPGVGATLAGKFLKETGSGLRFFRPDEAPNISDVFDFCLPDCNPETGTADTLFSVVPIPPSQGSEKLKFLRTGGLQVSWYLLFAVVASIFVAPLGLKRISVAALSVLLIFTPAGSYLGMDRMFSSKTFFVEALGPLSNSAGDLIVTAAFVLVVVVGLWRLRLNRNIFTFLGSILLVAATPYVLRIVAHGITPSSESGGLSLWLSWELGVTLTSSALIVIAAALVRGKSAETPVWMSLLAVGLAVSTAVLGILIWTPGPGAAWPEWYTFLWIPALLLAAQPASTVRLVSTVAVVAGSASALLTWGATVEGHMLLANRDVATLGNATDIAAISALEEIAAIEAAEYAPSTESDLYEIWGRSSLRSDGFPLVMGLWDQTGTEVVRFDLALLTSDSSALRAAVDRVRATGRYELTEMRLSLGRHLTLAVPYADGTVLTVVVGPRSNLVPTSGVGQRLGLGAQESPFRLSIAGNSTASDPLDAVDWRRDGWKVVGTRRLLFPGGDRRVTAEVSLLGFGRLLVRGALVVLFNLFALVLLWMLGEVLAGRVEILSLFKGWVDLSAYRTRLVFALAAFFIIPTLGFAGWSLLRLRGDSRASNELLAAQQLHDVSHVLSPDDAGRYGNSVHRVSRQFGTDLSLYSDGILSSSGNELFLQIGLVDPLVSDEAFVELVLDGNSDVVLPDGFAGAITAYRALPVPGENTKIVAMAGTPSGTGSQTPQGDVILAVLLASLLGVAAAMWLASVTAGSMTKPLRALKQAAAAVGQGKPVPPVLRPIPAELDSVVEAFERMSSDVREHQNALESTVNFTQAVLRHVATGVIALDRDLEVGTANPRAEALLATTLATGTTIDRQTSDSWKPVWDWVETFVAGKSSSDVKEFTVGGRRVKVLVAVLGGDDGGCVVVLDDVTDLTRAERVLAWGEMARQVAHEIKNPLTPMRLGIQHLQRAHRDGRADFGALLDQTSEQILVEIERLDSIARGFSQFGSPVGESTPLGAVELQEVAREAAALYGMSGNNDVSVTGAAGVFAMVRRDEFKQLLVNLVENSRDADARKVEIRIHRYGELVQVKVVDDGTGISPDSLPKIFEPSFSTTTSGTGLGLAICKRLVESWGGRISVESGSGGGTTVTVDVRSAAEGE